MWSDVMNALFEVCICTKKHDIEL